MADTFNFIKSTAVVWGPFASGLIAAFIAAFIVHLLTQSREREKWILDCKKQEFKELMSALAESYIWSIRMNVFSDADMQKSYAEANANALRVMRDRLYITTDLPLEDFVTKWNNTFSGMQPRVIRNEYEEIRTAIIDAANNSVPKTRTSRLQFWKSILKRRAKKKLA